MKYLKRNLSVFQLIWGVVHWAHTHTCTHIRTYIIEMSFKLWNKWWLFWNVRVYLFHFWYCSTKETSIRVLWKGSHNYRQTLKSKCSLTNIHSFHVFFSPATFFMLFSSLFIQYNVSDALLYTLSRSKNSIYKHKRLLFSI